MTITALTRGPAPVQVIGDTLTIRDLTVTHAEAAAYLRGQLAEHGPDFAADLVRRALPIGLVALSMGTAGIDTGALGRTLDGFARQVDVRATAALTGLDETLARLHAGESAIAQTARAVLDSLPARVEAALAGEAGNVRASVADAARAVQDAGLHELTAALDRHSRSVRDALSLDRGPVRMLRQDLLAEVSSTRRELSDQLALVRTLVEATQAANHAGAKSSRAIGAANEAVAMGLCQGVVSDAGDLFEATGDQPGTGGTTRRIGDGVATLSPAIAGPTRKVRIVLEAKHRSRPMSVKALRDEVAGACRVRDAVGGLVLVPTRAEVPGGGAFARLDSLAYVVAADDLETVRLIYLLLREQVAMLAVRQDGDAEVDLAGLETRITLALENLTQFDEVGRLAGQARTALDRLSLVGREAQAKVREHLIAGMALLHH